jgi:hypothetical protein
MYTFKNFLSETGFQLFTLLLHSYVVSWLQPFFIKHLGLSHIKMALSSMGISTFCTAILTVYLSPFNPVGENLRLVTSPIFFIVALLLSHLLLYRYFLGIDPYPWPQSVVPSMVISLPLIGYTALIVMLAK